MTLLIGQSIRDRYRILQVLAGGGMGTVYRAKDESLGIDVAIKEFLPGKISIEHQRRNAALIAGLNHPAIPRVTDAFETEDGSQILVMDYVPGEDLKTRIEMNGPLPLGTAVTIITSVGTALHFMHHQDPPVIHQDVKPGNIRITPDGKAILVDFDLAAEVTETSSGSTTSDQGLTPGYAAPEQYNRMSSPASDQYGLAATLFYLLTGVVLADGISRASGNSDLPEQASNRIPIDIQTCLKKALEINPVDRYMEIQSFLDALTSVIKNSPTISSTSTRKARFPHRRALASWLLILAAATIALILVSTIGLYLYNLPGVPSATVQVVMAQATVPAANQSALEVPATVPAIIPADTATPSLKKPTPLGGSSGVFAYAAENTGIPQVYLRNISSGEPVQLTNIAEGACQPEWSPDGKRMIVISPCPPKSRLTGKAEPYAGSGLFLVSVADGQVIPLPSQPGGDYDPSWSPDGKTIAYTSIQSNFPQIFILDIESEKTFQLTNTTGGNRQPTWSPDGSRLAFSSYRKGSWQIWLTSSEGLDPVAFSKQNNGAAFSADWSHDSKTIVFSQTNSLQLVSKATDNPDGPERILNTRLTGAANPDISPDGNWLLFDSKMDGDFRVYRISISGSGVESITPAGEIAYQPIWKPVP